MSCVRGLNRGERSLPADDWQAWYTASRSASGLLVSWHAETAQAPTAALETPQVTARFGHVYVPR